ncbi:MAG: DUF2950 domain-containing protein [Verrucomicrobiae bacterium]|nr:DUF2950 domain-containing protein [Verrucomicrobiae bacterium]
MKTFPQTPPFARFHGIGDIMVCVLMALLAIHLPAASPAAQIGKTFSTPEAAVDALAAAANARDQEALRSIFGPASDEIISVDEVQMANSLTKFTAALNQAKSLAHFTENSRILEVGKNRWPFPIPLVKKDGQWFFDAEAGKEEVLNRRIGKNELSTLKAVRAYVEAQREYASRDRMGNDVLQYARKILSSPGKKDGLYWSSDLDGEISPLGPLMAQARAEGYIGPAVSGVGAPQPFHGYFYKVLPRQGKSASGGQYNYVINGNMIGGFALVAYPAHYGESGVMTFIVNHRGRVYQKNLGPKTCKLAAEMKEFDPDPSWKLSKD